MAKQQAKLSYIFLGCGICEDGCYGKQGRCKVLPRRRLLDTSRDFQKLLETNFREPELPKILLCYKSSNLSSFFPHETAHCHLRRHFLQLLQNLNKNHPLSKDQICAERNPKLRISPVSTVLLPEWPFPK